VNLNARRDPRGTATAFAFTWMNPAHADRAVRPRG